MEKAKKSEMRSLSNDEFLALSRKLDNYHAVFYKFWLIGKPFFTEDVKTACVSFDRMRHGQAISFLFNPKFWDSLDENIRMFVICHEMLHIILNHGVRIMGISDSDMELANRALDVVVNHLLVKNFGFKREELGWIGKEGCWVDTVFPGQNIPENENFEYYFDLLKSNKKVGPTSGLESGAGSGRGKGAGSKGDGVGKTIVIDDHNGLLESASDAREIVDKLNDMLSNDDKNSLRDMIKKHFSNPKGISAGGLQAGLGTGGWMFVDVGKVSKKKKWETVIKKWSKKYLAKDCYDFEQWARINRRLATLSRDLMLPSEMEEDRPKEDKIEVYFFQDVSGSCIHLKERFLKAAKSLPGDRFKVRAFSFDTCVHAIDLKSGKIYGGGGTSFSVLEKKIQEIMRSEKVQYPKAIFVITDGYGDRIKPQIPKNWYWFLSVNCKSYIPAESSIFELKNFE
jgi:hypothetical protein